MAIQGKHADNMLFVIDEAPGVPEHIYSAIENTCTQPNNMIFAIFNPNKNTGWAIDTQSKMSHRWICKQINAQNSTLVDKGTIEYKKERYGADSNIFRVDVLGLPPLADDGSFIPFTWIEDAKNRYDEYSPEENDPFILSLDVGGGGDPSMVCVKHGRKILKFHKYDNSKTDAVVEWFEGLLLKYKPDDAYVDSITPVIKSYDDSYKSQAHNKLILTETRVKTNSHRSNNVHAFILSYQLREV